MSYKAPMDDMRFILNEVLKISDLSKFDGLDMLDDDIVTQILTEGAKFSEEVLHPINLPGDREGCHYDRESGDVKTPKGFKDAYQKFKDGMWNGLSSDPEYGGMGMPRLLDVMVKEMFCSGNMAFGMYPGLSHGVYHALHAFGTDEQKNAVLEKLITSEWTGTMCLTEAGCGTDLGLMKTKAIPQADGSYKIEGEKIFISSGDHDMTDNIMHLVLAKIDDTNLPEDDKTPKGIKGVSLFLVSKKKLDKNGQLTDQNNGVKCGGLEEKMGIHGNATCVMQFDSATAELVGEKHKGMRAMFVMMNDARLNVGLQALGLMEASYQGAVEYAETRLQGKSLSGVTHKNSTDKADPIIVHPGVRQELMTMKAMTEGGRMFTSWIAMQQDIAKYSPDADARKQAEDTVALLTPVVKSYMTDIAVDATNMGMQIMGGHGYIEEYGMAQYNRDARITRMYEGTNGVQALDLMLRKVLQQDLMPNYAQAIKADIKSAKKVKGMGEFIKPVEDAQSKLTWTMRKMKMKCFRKSKAEQIRIMEAAAPEYLRMVALLNMSHMWMKMAQTANEQLQVGAPNPEFYQAKLETARFFAQKMLPEMHSLSKKIGTGPKTLMEMSAESFARTNGTVGEKTREEKPAKKSGFGL